MGNFILQLSPELQVASMFQQLQSQQHQNGTVSIYHPISGSIVFSLSSSKKDLWNITDHLHVICWLENCAKDLMRSPFRALQQSSSMFLLCYDLKQSRCDYFLPVVSDMIQSLNSLVLDRNVVLIILKYLL